MKTVLMIGGAFSIVEGVETILLPGNEYPLPNDEADELIARGLADESKKIKKVSAKRATKNNSASDSSGKSSGRKRISKSGPKRRGQSDNGNNSKRRKSSKKSNKPKPKK